LQLGRLVKVDIVSDRVGRREFLGAAAAGALGAAASFGQEKKDEKGTGEREVRLEFLRPKEIEEAQAACATIFSPLGTIEWHGVHNVVGVDAVKAHALCIRAAQRGGGVVMPALFGGVGGMSEPHTFVMEEENSVFSNMLRPWLEQLCREMARDGFRAIIILTGHYGAAQQIVVRETAVRMSRALGIPVLGTPECTIAMDVGYTGDHGAWGETSLMMHLYPETVRLERLGNAPHKGVGGRDPKTQASAKDGRMITETIVSRLAVLAEKMPKWGYETLDRFVDAESTLVAKQLSAPRGRGAIWTAWQNIGRAMRDYGRQLVEERFDEIKASVLKL
jgi:creatinine amidohydrolase